MSTYRAPGPRTLVLTPDFPPMHGGIQLLVDRVVRHAPTLQARVLTLGAPGAQEWDASAPFEVRRVRRVGHSKPMSNALLNAIALPEALRIRPDAVLCAHVVAAPAAAMIGRIGHSPVIQYLYANEAIARPRLTRFALRSASATVAISAYTERLACEAGADQARIHLIPPGVDLPEARTYERDVRPTILTIARLRDAYKGHDTMIRALPAVRARLPDVRWVVIGDGPLRPWLERMAVERGIASCVDFLGTVSDAERDAWLERAHVFAMPSRLPAGEGGEGFGIVYLEAAARGLPAVAGKVGGALDAVVNGETGLLVDPEDATAVGAALTRLLTDSELAANLGRAGAERAKRFAWPVVAARLDELITGLACPDGI